MEMGALKIEDFTGGSDQTLGKKNPLLYIIWPKRASYLSLPEEPYKSIPRPVLKDAATEVQSTKF